MGTMTNVDLSKSFQLRGSFYPLQWISGHCLICFRGHSLFLFDFSLSRNRYVWKAKIPCSLKIRLFSHFLLLSRLFRIFPRGSSYNNRNTVLFGFNGSIFKLDLISHQITKDLALRSGMRAPLNICHMNDSRGNGYFVFGEYFNNPLKNPVVLWGKKDEEKSDWSPFYSFPAHSIRHIHEVIQSPSPDSVLIFTGDDGEEAGIFQFSFDTKKLSLLIRGNQENRSCAAYVTGSDLWFATDSPFIQNHLSKISLGGGLPLKILPGVDLEGTVINSVAADTLFFYSTCVESNLAKGGDNKNEIIPVDGKNGGIRSHSSILHVFNGCEDRVLLKGTKDFFGIHYFGFGTFVFANGYFGLLAFRGFALKRFHSITILPLS